MMKKGIPFSNAPGVAYEYSNYGFAILGRIVARASGTPYNEYVSTHILSPLGMRSTTLSPAAVPAGRLAHGYRWEDEQWKEEPQLPDGAFGAMGGMLTSLSDLGRYVSAFLGAWPPRDGPETGPVRRSSLREMQQVWRPDVAERRPRLDGTQADHGGIRLRARRVGQLPVRAHRGAQRRSAGIRFPDAVAARVRHRDHRVRQPDLYPMGQPIAAALTVLNETGALRAREAIPAKALVNAREQVTKLILDWDDELARSLAAQNLFLDRSIDRRRADIAALRTQSGRCKAASGFAYVENALRGQWILPCERGDLLVSVTLAPTMPPTVQFLEVTPAPPPEEVGPPALCDLKAGS